MLGVTKIFQEIRVLVPVFNISPTEIALGSTPGLLSHKPVNNGLNHDTTRKKMLLTTWKKICFHNLEEHSATKVFNITFHSSGVQSGLEKSL